MRKEKTHGCLARGRVVRFGRLCCQEKVCVSATPLQSRSASLKVQCSCALGCPAQQPGGFIGGLDCTDCAHARAYMRRFGEPFSEMARRSSVGEGRSERVRRVSGESSARVRTGHVNETNRRGATRRVKGPWPTFPSTLILRRGRDVKTRPGYDCQVPAVPHFRGPMRGGSSPAMGIA